MLEECLNVPSIAENPSVGQATKRSKAWEPQIFGRCALVDEVKIQWGVAGGMMSLYVTETIHLFSSEFSLGCPSQIKPSNT